MNSEIRELREKIVNDINESGLPIEVVRLVFIEIIGSLNAECDKVIALEKAEKEKGEQND